MIVVIYYKNGKECGAEAFYSMRDAQYAIKLWEMLPGYTAEIK